ncbi:MAG: glycosyltransferase family 39 protein [Candidatus Binatia bacterium]|nr:glycosyltransferase family 39 protein [Candidatus Binatia bacterium]
MERRSRALAALSFGSLFVLKLPLLALPYHWDEAGAYVSRALWLADSGLHRALPGLHPPTQFFGHPPGLYLLLASAYRLFGHSIWLTHLVAVTLGATTLYLTFRVGERIGGSAAAFVSALFLLLNPLFFAQAGLMHGDMAVAALGLAATLFYLEERRLPYFVSAVALLLAKETGLGIVVGIAVYHALVRSDRPRHLREAVVLATPGLMLAAFFAASWITTGRLLNNSYFDTNTLVTLSFEKVRWVSRWLFVEQGRWILTACTVVALTFGRREYRFRELPLLALVVIPFWAAFGALYVLPRYLLPAFPFLSVAAGLGVVALGRRWKLVPVVAVIAAGASFALTIDGTREGSGSYENNLEYVDVVETHRELAAWLEAHHQGAVIAAGWPLGQVLREPRLGYVSVPLNSASTHQHPEILAWTAQGDAFTQSLVARAEGERWEILERFENGGKVAAAFGRPARRPVRRHLPEKGTVR